MIYCVVPEPLADELYPKLAGYYEDDPNVTVIVDRRKKERRLPGSTGGGQREVRDRRRDAHHGRLPAARTGRVSRIAQRAMLRGTATRGLRFELVPAGPGFTSARSNGSPAGSRRPARPW